MVGNGLLGAAAADHLAASGRSVCVVGAAYGEGRLFSSHEDESRIVRLHHDDPFWEELAVANQVLMADLIRATGVAFFRRTPVYYRRPRRRGPHVRPIGIGAALAARARGFDWEDTSGGILDPRAYVQALDQRARTAGTTFVSAAVTEVTASDDGYRVRWNEGEVTSRQVVDARGMYGAGASGDVAVVGKVFVYVTSDMEEVPSPFCFIDWTGTPAFSNVYGCVGYQVSAGQVTSKFGFTDRDPQRLESPEAIASWFEKGYLTHPRLQEALDCVSAFGLRDGRVVHFRPCAFSVTVDGRPRLRREGGRIVITGCNGAAAKCCQVIAAQALSALPFEAGV